MILPKKKGCQFVFFLFKWMNSIKRFLKFPIPSSRFNCILKYWSKWSYIPGLFSKVSKSCNPYFAPYPRDGAALSNVVMLVQFDVNKLEFRLATETNRVQVLPRITPPLSWATFLDIIVIHKRTSIIFYLPCQPRWKPKWRGKREKQTCKSPFHN